MPVAGLGKPKVLKEVKLTAVAARRRCDNTIPAFKNAWARARVSLFLFIQQEIMQNHLRYFEQMLRAQTLQNKARDITHHASIHDQAFARRVIHIHLST